MIEGIGYLVVTFGILGGIAWLFSRSVRAMREHRLDRDVPNWREREADAYLGSKFGALVDGRRIFGLYPNEYKITDGDEAGLLATLRHCFAQFRSTDLAVALGNLDLRTSGNKEDRILRLVDWSMRDVGGDWPHHGTNYDNVKDSFTEEAVVRLLTTQDIATTSEGDAYYRLDRWIMSRYCDNERHKFLPDIHA